MPQIGWFEILIVVVLAIIIIGPKDFPIVVNKVGGWIGTAKRYFNEIQKNVTDMGSAVEKEISLEENYSQKAKDNNKDER